MANPPSLAGFVARRDGISSDSSHQRLLLASITQQV
jgi:hypothetical protein